MSKRIIIMIPINMMMNKSFDSENFSGDFGSSMGFVFPMVFEEVEEVEEVDEEGGG